MTALTMARIPVIPSSAWPGDQVPVVKWTIDSIIFSMYFIIITDSRISISQNHPIFKRLKPILFKESSAIICDKNIPTNFLNMKQSGNI